MKIKNVTNIIYVLFVWFLMYIYIVNSICAFKNPDSTTMRVLLNTPHSIVWDFEIEEKSNEQE